MHARPPIRIRLEGFRGVNCHYDLSGNSFGDRCPECGWDVSNSVQSVDFSTRGYAVRTILSAFTTLITMPVPLAGLYCLYVTWRWHRGAAVCCEEERIQSSRFWYQWSTVAVAIATLAGLVNLIVTAFAARWLLNHFLQR